MDRACNVSGQCGDDAHGDHVSQRVRRRGITIERDVTGRWQWYDTSGGRLTPCGRSDGYASHAEARRAMIRVGDGILDYLKREDLTNG